jgi:hypothetical protein
MKNKAPSVLDSWLLPLNPKYPIYGTFLQKYNFISTQMKRLEEEYSGSISDLSTIHNEFEKILTKAQAESSTAFGRYIQYIFSFYPYDEKI